MARFRRGASRRPVVRRKMIWNRVSVATISFDAGFSFDVLQPYRTDVGILTNQPGNTLVRTRLNAQWQSNGAETLTAQSGVVAGIYVDRIGTPVVSAPLQEPYVDWLYWEWIPWTAGQTIEGPVASTTYSFSREIDVKAMRKLEEVQQTVYFCWEATGGNTFTSFVGGSFLLKLP